MMLSDLLKNKQYKGEDMNRIVRLPSSAESKNAEERNAKAWFPQVGVWWKTKKSQIMFKIDIFADQVFMLSEPKEEEQKEPGDDL